MNVIVLKKGELFFLNYHSFTCLANPGYLSFEFSIYI